MSLYNSYDRTNFLGEVNTPLDTQMGVLTPAQQKAKILANLGIGVGGAIATGNIDSTGHVLSSSPSGGIGYETGSGGAVTQLTGRTTGVTLNTVTGAITLFAAAPSTVPTAFTLTNSAIAAGDVVVASVQSSNAANTYVVEVIATAAGSCKIAVFSQAGTTSDSPVLNFAVIKGSAS